MKSKIKLFAEIIAVVIFALGVVVFTNAHRKPEQPKSFVISYKYTRIEQGQEPVIQRIVRVVNSDGEMKQTTYNTEGKIEEIRFLDKIAGYKLVGSHLDYAGTSEPLLKMDSLARSASWLAEHPLFVREETILGLKAYIWHKDLSDGWTERTYSPMTGITPLLEHEKIGDIETTLEAISIQFQKVSPDEIAPPNLPISFDQDQSFEQALRSGGDETNNRIADRMAELRNTDKEKLRAQGRIQ